MTLSQTLSLPAPYTLHQPHAALPFALRRDGIVVESVSPLGRTLPTLEAEDSPELRAFAAAMTDAADDFRPMDADVPRDGSGFLAFGRHDIDNGRRWRVGDFWYAIILWDVWTGRAPSWVFSLGGTPVWSEPTHYRVLKPPRAVAAAIAAGAAS